ncbi:MAG: c-type cytochrome [Usitatibacter sp.]
MRPRGRAAAAALFLLGAGLAARAPAADDAAAMRRLAAERGCGTCHQEQPAARGTDAIIPAAPSWHDIASRYRGRAGAEDDLTRIVVAGSDPTKRHWKNQAAFVEMLPNGVQVSAGEARALVRWILSTR